MRGHLGLLKSALALAALFAALTVNSGCASFGKKLKNFFNGGNQEEAQVQQRRTMGPKFSEQENIRYSNSRQYRRMNRNRFEEEADVGAAAGSLWVTEGQSAYLFAQNTTRMVGDPCNVKLEGGPKVQLQTKVRVIAKLLERLEAPPPARGLAGQGAPAPGQPPAAQLASGQPGQQGAQPAGGQTAATAPNPELAKVDANFSVDKIPTRIVEIMKDGSYRVKGTQAFMIGKREYKVIVTGIVRPDDFNEDNTSAAKLLDAQFDVVSTKKGIAL